MISPLIFALAAVDLVSADKSPLPTTPPSPITLRVIDPARALAEFDALCLVPMFDLERTKAVAAISSLNYGADPPFLNDERGQQRWEAAQAVATLTYSVADEARGLGLPQCEVTMVGIANHSGHELLEMIKPHLARFVPRPLSVREEAGDFEINWLTDDPEISLELRAENLGVDDKTRSLDFTLTMFSSAGRALEDQVRRQKAAAGGSDRHDVSQPPIPPVAPTSREGH